MIIKLLDEVHFEGLRELIEEKAAHEPSFYRNFRLFIDSHWDPDLMVNFIFDLLCRPKWIERDEDNKEYNIDLVIDWYEKNIEALHDKFKTEAMFACFKADELVSDYKIIEHTNNTRDFYDLIVKIKTLSVSV